MNKNCFVCFLNVLCEFDNREGRGVSLVSEIGLCYSVRLKISFLFIFGK